MNANPTSLRVNLIGWDNPAGLGRDFRLLQSVLEQQGAKVVFTGFRGRSPSRLVRVLHRLNDYGLAWRHRAIRRRLAAYATAEFDVNVFLERPEAAQLSRARFNVLIPNQEWFQASWKMFLGNFDRVLAKTRTAAKIFGSLGCEVEFIGFTANDRWLEGASRDYTRFLHVAGRSALKGTGLVLRTWARHPHWPELTVVQNANQASDVEAPNIRVIKGPIPDDALRRLQNECGVHLCPSEAEGFGHTLVEAMSCGALVVTTDGEPMNELVSPERGLLLRPESVTPLCLGRRFHISEATFVESIEALLKMPMSGRRSRGTKARSWFEKNDGFFREHLPKAIFGLGVSAPRRSAA